VTFSDMGESASVDLESPNQIDVGKEIGRVQTLGLVSDLEGIEVFIFGVHAKNKSAAYLPTLKAFWVRYFERARARLQVFSAIRDVSLIGLSPAGGLE